MSLAGQLSSNPFLFGIAGLIFAALLAWGIIGSTTGPSQADVSQARSDGFADGRRQGLRVGQRQGKDYVFNGIKIFDFDYSYVIDFENGFAGPRMKQFLQMDPSLSYQCSASEPCTYR